MKIKIDKIKKELRTIGYRADFIELSGSPFVGTGSSIAEAVATLFIRNIDNLKNLNNNTLFINDKPYKDYIKNNR